MLKVSFFRGEDENGPRVIPLFGPADSVFEKTAAPFLLPEVAQYIETLHPRKDAQYVLVNAMGASEYWGCFPAGTLVRTAAGEVPIEKIPVGASVLTHKNRCRPVEAVESKQYEGTLVDLFVQGLPALEPSLTATPNHELWVVPAEELHRARWEHFYGLDARVPVATRRAAMVQAFSFSWRALGKLRHGDLIAQPFPLEEDAAALGDAKWNDPDIAFLMGLYVAEGCTALQYRSEKPVYDKLRNGKFERPLKSIVLVIGSHEGHKVERVRQVASAHGYSLCVVPDEETHSIRIELSWQAFAELCKDHIGDHANEKRLSPKLLRMPRVWQKEFFFAYAGGDGCRIPEGSKGEGSIRCVSASVGLLVDVRLLLARLGFAASISGRHNKKATWYAGRPIYELLLGGSQLRGEHSQAKSYLHPSGFILSAVKRTKEYAWSGTVYDLQVAEDCSYTSSGISAHNSNINMDAFPEASLIHKPDSWTGNPVLDRIKSKNWAYGFPTFYNAHTYCHHRNKDPLQSIGDVELAAWHDHMKRVELVLRVDEEKCQRFGGTAVWDKLRAGMFPAVSMGCAPSGTRVTLWDGAFKNIEDVQEGDIVLSHCGASRRVSRTMRRRYEGRLYQFKIYGFARTLSVTDEHPLWLVRADQLYCQPTPKQVNKGRRQRHCTPFTQERTRGCAGCQRTVQYDFSWVRADQAEVGDCLAFPIPTAQSDDISSLDEARLLGYYLAEGFVCNYNDRSLNQITFCLNMEEKEIAVDIEATARRLGAQTVWHQECPERGGRYVHVVHPELAQKCLVYCGAYAKEKRVSHEVLFMKKELQLAFLGAYLDGDGGTYKGSAYFSTSSEQLAHQLFVMLARCGVIASVNTIEHHPSEKSVVRKDTTEYQVWVGTDFSPIMGPFTRKPVHGSIRIRGQRFFYEYAGVRYLMSPIVEIEESAYDDTVFNFSVDGDDSYVAEGLAVHNCRVPYDTCSICLDWDTYRKAQATFIPGKNSSPGDAVLRWHKTKPIRGVSITRKDYCEHARKEANRIYPDGRKVFVYNDYPKFFDISFVFIGADRTAKTMMKIADSGKLWSLPGAELAEKLGYAEGDEELMTAFDPVGINGLKTAADTELKLAFLGKNAKDKDAEIVKDVVPSQFAGKAVPLLTRSEEDLPKEVLDMLGAAPLEQSLSTSSALGMVLRPREFQRIMLIQVGKRSLADELDEKNEVFPKVEEELPVPMGPASFSSILARILGPLMMARSALGPHIEKRVVVMSVSPEEKTGSPSSHSSELMRKIGAAYNSYRSGLMELVAHAQDLVASMASPSESQFHKLAEATPDSIFTPLSAAYLKQAFWDEVGTTAVVERGSPSRNIAAICSKTAEGS